MDTAFIKWLHELTVKLYEHDIILSADREAEIKSMYDHGKSTGQACEILAAASK